MLIFTPRIANTKKQSSPTLNTSKNKYHSRGFSSSSLLETLAVSPIRNIVNHITTSSSGSYDVTKEAGHKRVSSDVSLLQVNFTQNTKLSFLIDQKFNHTY